MVCENSLLSNTHVTCRCCRRYRGDAARHSEGGPLCAGCASYAPAMHTCPDCSEAVPGQGTAQCDACSLWRLIARRLAAHTGSVQPAWARTMYNASQDWDALPVGHYGAVR